MNNIFPIILYSLGSILLVVLIILVIKMMKTLKKIDTAIDDYNEKSKKLNGVFDLIDTATDTISSIGDRLVTSAINGITKLFTKKKKKEESENE